MDFGTIKQKLSKRQYKTLFELGDDVRKIWHNCMTYNADGSDFYKLAEALSKRWEEKFTKLLQDLGEAAPAADNSKPTLNDKRNFAKALFTISKEDLGKVLVEVEGKCPAAITRNASEDEVELNVDKLPAVVLQELMQFVDGAKGKKKSAKKQKSK